jgi:hypothetical protein
MFRAGAFVLIFVCASLTIVAGCGTVDRRMSITSEPPGALVYMNDQEVGRTPVKREFTWYGVYDVQVRADGYETKFTKTRVIAPIWQWPPFDLMAELAPIHWKDVHKIHYHLRPATTQAADPDLMLARAEQLRIKLQSSQHTRQAATLPASMPATTQSTQPSTEPATTQSTQPSLEPATRPATAPAPAPVPTQPSTRPGKFL